MSFKVMEELSAIVMPFILRENPHFQHICDTHEQWIETAKILESDASKAAFRGINVPLLVSYTFPSLEGYALELFTRFMSWTFLYDDALDAPKERHDWMKTVDAMLSKYRGVLYGADSHEDAGPLVIAWRDIVLQVQARVSEAMLSHHRQSWDDVYDACRLEAKHDASLTVPTFNEYVQIRRITGGVPILLDWVEICEGFELPRWIRADSLFIDLKSKTADVVDMVNDIYSLPKEQAHGNTDNAVMVLANEQACSLKEATTLVVQLVKNSIDGFVQNEHAFYSSVAYEALSTVHKRNVDKYLETMKNWMVGSFEWHKSCERYLV